MMTSEELDAALVALGIEKTQDIFSELVAAHNKFGRYYHTTEHIDRCMLLLEEYQHLAERPAELTIAIYFHDAIYNSRRFDNEEKSAAWAKTYLESQHAEQQIVERVLGIIMATKDHYAQTKDQKLMIDIDLSIFGVDPEEFDRYNHAIRQEYLWVTDSQYYTSRANVMRRFLDRENLYYLPEFRERFEKQARINLATIV